MAEARAVEYGLELAARLNPLKIQLQIDNQALVHALNGASNYISEKLQVEALLVGHDLFVYADGSNPCPPPVITIDGTELPNPEYTFWTRQDRLLFGALIGAISQNLVPLISQAKTSAQLWEKFHSTYALPSRGHIKQLKDKFNRIVKGPSSITDYMRQLKECSDHLVVLGKPIDHEDLIDKVLAG
ncbi:uncharacterized protein LOC110733949 [Chenopodium quinoa]|uniref:uncharacterized protein LOC110733949 n=1 Tax=Chenopodium quinoa TaxID=63459 RepID=UPI000B77BAC1|nr:uncharacterized protein LOC110733949 [Chenopodium quinoa]